LYTVNVRGYFETTFIEHYLPLLKVHLSSIISPGWQNIYRALSPLAESTFIEHYLPLLKVNLSSILSCTHQFPFLVLLWPWLHSQWIWIYNLGSRRLSPLKFDSHLIQPCMISLISYQCIFLGLAFCYNNSTKNGNWWVHDKWLCMIHTQLMVPTIAVCNRTCNFTFWHDPPDTALHDIINQLSVYLPWVSFLL
jgi:hypothetical protein